MLIVLEGLDGAGKSTQVSLLKEYLQSKTGALEYIHFPRYNAPIYGDLIGKFLRGGFGSLDSVHPQLVALLFAEDRRDASTAIKAALEQGKTVLLDRYVYSNIAYQCSKLENTQEIQELRDWIFNTEYLQFGIPKPDLNIFLDVPIEFVEKSLKSNRDGGDRDYLHGSSDIHEANIGFQKKVQAMYRAQAESDKHFIPVNCADSQGHMMAPDAIFDRIKAVVDTVL